MTNSLLKESDSMCRAIEDLEKEIYSYHWVQQAGREDRPRRGLIDIVGKGLKDRKSTRLNSSHLKLSRMPSSA